MTATPWPVAGDVHLYALALPRDAGELARLGGFLTPDEKGRAAQLKSAEAAQRFVAGRGLLRELLGGYLGVAACRVPLATTEHGKPYLAGGHGRLRFNLAHCGDNVLLAVADRREVGVDIEKIAPDKPLREMAALAFSRREQADLAALAAPGRETFFYRCWVRREACLKGCGLGFTLPAERLDLAAASGESPVITARCDRQHWKVLDVAAPPGYCAALAVAVEGAGDSAPRVVRPGHRLALAVPAPGALP